MKADPFYNEQRPFTEDDLDNCWQYYKEYLINILNGDYDVKVAREDLRGLIGSNYDKRIGMTAEEKAKEYLKEFSVEKSIDLVETMLEVAEGIPSPEVPPKYWRNVLKAIHEINGFEEKMCPGCGGSGRMMMFKNDEHTPDEWDSCIECFGLGIVYELK